MITKPFRFIKLTTATSVALAALMMTSCVTSSRSSPEQVEMSNPTVTYKYRNDDELIQANQRAVTFCRDRQALPQPQNFSRDSNGHNIVVFECVPSSSLPTSTPMLQSGSDLRYDFRTDQELLDVSRNAQIYCLNSGSPEMDSNIVVNSNGSKTVTFRCSNR